eukprot:TRINITY_DN72086_c0_g1_i1.p1 TRINITY_DN72086_c0_g1~~TRINITY_DN72086_c0_g1_i1.p1  ORF type:complete len:406 (-),score=84.99 TRINITY_DN72086_c0_g1_i1:18-1103(-)
MMHQCCYPQSIDCWEASGLLSEKDGLREESVVDGEDAVLKQRSVASENKLCTFLPDPSWLEATQSTSSFSKPTHAVKKADSMRDSQAAYINAAQTLIVFDWDDTLFPTAHILRKRCDLMRSLQSQGIAEEDISDLETQLGKLRTAVEELLFRAHGCGRVVIVTLSREGWVKASCERFIPGLEETIQALGIKIIYAGLGHEEENARFEESKENRTWHFAKLKADAIWDEASELYSQYEGQSWKNILSIGDSNFERVGTKITTETYMKRCTASALPYGKRESPVHPDDPEAVVLNGHVYKLRTKTLKTASKPSLAGLLQEVNFLRDRLLDMVLVDASFDLALPSAEPDALQKLDEALTALDPT